MLAVVAAVSSALAPFDLMVQGSGVAAGQRLLGPVRPGERFSGILEGVGVCRC